MDLYVNESFKLTENESLVFIEVFKPGFDIKDFSQVTDLFPRIRVTAYGALVRALQAADRMSIAIGAYRPKIDLEISKDEMNAYVRLYMTSGEIEAGKETLVSEILELLAANDIHHGIRTNVLDQPLSGDQKIHVAEGVLSEHGADAILRYYEMGEKKPEIRTDGSANHYELNLIDQAYAGDWLGEKIPPTEGKPGESVTGKPLKPKNGRDKRLKYDPKTVDEVFEDDKFVLRAKVDGAVRVRDGKIGIDNHLVVGGNVDYSTGNIDFDGYVTVNGTVEDGFSVIAQQDITINGEMGVGAIERIESKQGSVLIKGGISGKGIGRVYAGKNIYVKFANEAHLVAGQIINVGLYSLDSYLKANKIIVNPVNGKVIGGEIHAEHQVVTGSIGNKFEKRTVVNVKGFERLSIKDELDNVLMRYRELIKEADGIRRQLEIFEANMGKLDERAIAAFRMLTAQYEGFLDEALGLNNRILELQEILKTRGEGEVKVLQAVYPKTMLEIKNMQKKVREMTTGSFYVKDHNLHFEDN